MSPLWLFTVFYWVTGTPQDRSAAVSKTFGAKFCGISDRLRETRVRLAFPHSLGRYLLWLDYRRQ